MKFTDLDEMGATVAQRFRAVTIKGLSRKGRRPTFRFGVVPGTGVGMALVDFGRAVVCEAKQPIDFVPLQLPLSGSAEVRSGQHAFQSHAGVGISPGVNEPLALHTSDDWQMHVFRLRMQSVLEELTGLLGYAPEAPLHLHPRIDFTTPGGQRLRALLDVAANRQSGAVVENLDARLACEMLVSQRHNYSEALANVNGAATPALVRRAQDYAEANLHTTMTAKHLAIALHTSVRSLNRGFRRYLDTTPMAYVHECRLQAARRALLQQRDGDFVTRIAEDCGFTHLGRFAVNYKRRFGESPSTSLKGAWRVPATAG
jgi:AraC-like DNA-binding protein